MQIDTSSKFTSFLLSEEDSKQALQVSPFFLAYLQNKIEAYASALVESSLPYDPNPAGQVTAILAHEKLRNFVLAYEELLSEIIQASNQPSPN